MFEGFSLKEQEVARSLRQVSIRDPEYACLLAVLAATIESIQEVLPEDTTLIEYFIARGEVLVFVVSRAGAEVHRHLCPADRIWDIQNRLGFHLEKFILGTEYLRHHSAQIFHATRQYLSELYRNLFKP